MSVNPANANTGQSGFLHPFNLETYKAAIPTGTDSAYNVGIKLFCIHFCGAPCLEFPSESGPLSPMQRKGPLMRMSPEEVTGAIVLAIKRDICNDEPEDTLLAGRRVVLSTPCTFRVLPTPRHPLLVCSPTARMGFHDLLGCAPHHIPTPP